MWCPKLRGLSQFKYSKIVNMAFSEDQISNLKLLLEIQSEGYKNSISLLHEEIKDIKKEFATEIGELRKSLEFSQNIIDDLQNKVSALENESHDYSNQLKTFQSLQHQLNKQEDYSRRANIKIDGIKDNMKETYEQTMVKVKEFLREKLDLGNIDIDLAHRLPGSDNVPNHRPRTIIARLSRLYDRNTILRNTWKLRNTGIWINEDLCDESIKQRKMQKPQLDAARASGKIAYFRGTKLIVKNKPSSSLPVSSVPGTPPARRQSMENVFSPQNLTNMNAPPSPYQKKSNAPKTVHEPKNLRPRLLSQSKSNKT